MAILSWHVSFYREIFAIPDLLAEPFLMLGFQTIEGDGMPPEFDYPDGKQLLLAKGLRDLTTLDLFDDRADLSYDLNLPVPPEEHEKYRTVFDIGTLEHVFDTRQCLENCMRMVKPGGRYVLHTPVKGYFGHGFHTFHPGLITQAFTVNDFEIEYLKFSSGWGARVERPAEADNALIWIVGRKKAPLGDFRIPQQGKWTKVYSEESADDRAEEEAADRPR
jgi:hypothetical protein